MTRSAHLLPPGLAALLLLLLLPSGASAQEGLLAERGAVRLRAGAAQHRALFVQDGQARPYAGWTGEDLGLSAQLFGAGPLGAAVQLEQEGMRLSPTGGLGGAYLQRLVRGHLALAARAQLGPVLLGARVGYGFAQLPLAPAGTGPAGSGWRHGVVLAPRARLALPAAFLVEVSGELALPLVATGLHRQPLEATGAALGVALGRRMGTVGPFTWSLWLDAQASASDAASGVGNAAYQRVTRLGLGTELAWDTPH